MTSIYSPQEIEKKWHDIWDREEAFYLDTNMDRPKFYALVEFPYPSGQGLHVGHPRPYTALDILARKKRMQGYNVLYPMGWDAFGLPTENYAILNKIHPKIVTENNVAHFKKQLKRLGYSFNWDQEINTTDPKYYRFTQWIFLKLFKAGLAYKSEMPINWCTSCKVGLANEEVVSGACERCGSTVVRKVKSQWMLKITEYAQKLLDGLDEVDYIERVKTSQKNWIGRSEGAEVEFKIFGSEDVIKVFTTRPDTLFGATYMVISPEHPIIEKHKNTIKNYDAIEAYKEQASKKSDFERTEIVKDKTGVCIEGLMAVNPVNNKEIPVFVSDYVLMTYGTGAIMAVPAHDERDHEFAKKFKLPIVEVVKGGNVEEEAYTNTISGVMINSGFIDGMEVNDAKTKITAWLEEQGIGKKKINYKLRDWVFSRQRYWGEPIPIIICEKCGYVPLPEEELPLVLPEVESYMPTDNGESPLAAMHDWVTTTCPCCGMPAKRETDTMPQWAGSSWYFLRYIDPDNDMEFAAKELIDYWMPVDWYNGGMEHTTLHLLYSRFWHRFLYDQGYVTTKEPYHKRTSHGMILGENGEKMSKSRGNVISPDEIVDEYGADTLRVYEMFIGAFDLSASWSNEGVKGCRRFLDRVWKLQDMLVESDEFSDELTIKMHQTIKKVTLDYEALKFNTAIAAMMALVNEFYRINKVTREELRILLILLNPAAPHITEEIWENLSYPERVYLQNWPFYIEEKTIEQQIEIAIQMNGKLKDTLMVSLEEEQEAIRERIMSKDSIIAAVGEKTIIKEVYVKGRIYNIVIK